ncbi:MAG: glycosyltransferase family 1 protein [Acidobacteriota bacterium]
MAYTIGIDARKLDDFGIGTYVRNLILGLAKLDTENRYVLFVGNTQMEGLPENFRQITESAPVYSVRELYSLSWQILRLRLDLYHATHYVLPAFLPCRAVVTIHDIIHLLFPEFLPNRLALFYARRMIRRGLMKGSRVIAVSHNTKADIKDYFAIDGKKIRVIYNGVEDVFRKQLPRAEIDAWLAKLGIARPYALFLGNPKPHKNLHNVLRAFARARELRPFEAGLLCVGDRGPTDLKTRQLCDLLGIADRVQFAGHVPQEALPAVYQGSELFLYPTLYEGFGLPVIEAMASGVPVITSNGSALREIAEGFAHLVDPLDVEELALGIARCMTEPELRNALIQLGLRRSGDFRWERAAEKTRDIYLSAIRSAAPPPVDPRSTEELLHDGSTQVRLRAALERAGNRRRKLRPGAES